MIICKCGCGKQLEQFSKWGYKRKYLVGHNLKSQIGDKHPMWKGGRKSNGRGYIQIWKPDHPFSDNHGYVLEHRLVMEKKLGRYLKPEEIIHHINGIKNDNRPENLEITNCHDHPSNHNKQDFTNRKCAICHGKTIIEKNKNGRTYEHWHRDNQNRVICNKCSSYRRNVLKIV